MKYRDILGFSKPKKKIIKEKSKPKKTILDNVKKELNEWHHSPPTEKRWSKNTFDTGLTEFEERGGKDFIKEVGASAQYKKYIKLIDKDFDSLVKSVDALKKLLIKNGAKKEALELGSIFVTNVGKFRKFMKIKFLRMIDKLL
tara:strand:- start:43 stop:471 length:429 start_codon:yes stop_codon:yes gene_type:complete